MKTKFFLLFFCFASIVNAQNLKGIKICINPGHGGYDSDDRNVVIAPYTSGDPNGFWESKSNLDKGLQLRTMLQGAGATVTITRTTNTTADDLPLSQIVAMANQMNADFMLAIHSNAGSGIANYVLQLYAGIDVSDTYTYPTATPYSDKSREISTEIAKNLYTNQITTWSSSYTVRGDKTFGRTAMGWSDGYGVLRGLAVPGTISEGMMHDYIPEAYRLMNMEYKWLEAWQFYKSFCTYFNGGQIITGNIAGSVRDSRIKLETAYNKFTGRDEFLPLNGAKLTLVESGETYTVDNLQNGVFVFKNLTPGVYHVKVENTGYYSQTQEIAVTANNTSYFNFGLNRVRSTPPQVISYSPNVALTDSVNASTDIVLNFNWDMDETSTRNAFSISPNVSGTITFEDINYTLRFTPDVPLEKTTLYTVTLAKTASHPDNMSMVEDFSFKFVTKGRNRLTLLKSYPYDGDNQVYYISPSFRLIFDRKLNTSNIQANVNVLDENGTALAKNARSFVNNTITSPYGSSYFNLTSNLTVGKEYTLVVNGDIVDEVGMKVVEPIKIRFKAVDVKKNMQTLIDSFETANYNYIPDLSSGIVNASISASSTKLFGSYSNRFTISYSNIIANAFFGFLNPINVTSDKVIGFHLFGDLTGNEVWLQFSIPGGEQFLKVCDLNFYGWEFHEVDLKDLPNASGMLLTGIKIARKNSYLFSATSDIYLDNMLLYDEPVLSVHKIYADLYQIYPNPASSMFYIKGLMGQKAILRIYSITGMLLKEVFDDKISVSDLHPGTYILKINSNGIETACPVFIKH